MKIPSFILDSMVWSYSRLSSYEQCPYGWYLHYILGYEDTPGFYTKFGSLIHKLLEQYYKGLKENPDEKMNIKVEFYEQFFDEMDGVIRPPGNIVTDYINKLSNYFDNLKPFDFNIMEVEKKFYFRIGDYNFIGLVDLIGEKDGDLIVVDHKSRDLKPRSKRKKPTQNDMLIDSMLRQLYIYCGAIKQEYGRFPTKLCFNCFKAGTFIEEDFDESKYNATMEWALKTIEDIKNEDQWYPDIDFYKCKWICGYEDCDYKELR